jgi:hypothetical protein
VPRDAGEILLMSLQGSDPLLEGLTGDVDSMGRPRVAGYQ